jgi:hypothetical protein
MRLLRTAAILLAFLSTNTSFSQSQDQLLKADFVITKVNIIPMNQPDRILHNQVLLIEKGKISYIGKYKSFGKKSLKAKIISGYGQYLMPGMADMHCHFPDSSEIKKYFFLNLLAGVTTLRSMKGQSYNLKEVRNRFGVPNLYLSTIITHKTELSKATRDSIIDAFRRREFDFIKVLSIKDSLAFDSLITATNRENLPICGHYLKNIGLVKLAASGYRSIEHLGGEEEIRERGSDFKEKVIEVMKLNDVYQCPTLDWYQLAYFSQDLKILLKRRGLEFVSDSVRAVWKKNLFEAQEGGHSKKWQKMRCAYTEQRANHLKILREYNERGIKILIGLDAGGNFSVPGFAMIEEMKLFKESGLTNYEILASATCSAAKYFNENNKWGTIEIGKEANMIILPKNPLHKLDRISHTKGVFLNSFYYERKELIKLIREKSK